ncbi:hypothetical protein Syun_017269 [Stephania yunnanensis]|uniref:Uncharacterized protein n=1 Tax=Stephania yunnanensis TaxID=152371 RepID=A0AAP0J680_9MAGN
MLLSSLLREFPRRSCALSAVDISSKQRHLAEDDVATTSAIPDVAVVRATAVGYLRHRAGESPGRSRCSRRRGGHPHPSTSHPPRLVRSL